MKAIFTLIALTLCSFAFAQEVKIEGPQAIKVFRALEQAGAQVNCTNIFCQAEMVNIVCTYKNRNSASCEFEHDMTNSPQIRVAGRAALTIANTLTQAGFSRGAAVSSNRLSCINSVDENFCTIYPDEDADF